MVRFIVRIYLMLAFFSDFIKEVDIVVKNVLDNASSEVLICYGKNSELSKILINHNLEKLKENERNKVDYKTINFNAFINDKDENILSQLCTFFDLESEKMTFESSCRAIENFFMYFENEEVLDKDFKTLDPITLKNLDKNTRKKNTKIIYVIFYENIEYLFHKQKQVLFYTILELVNNSKNIIFCGTTSNYDLTTLMEKRIRSRFSQKTFFLDLLNKNDIETTLQYLFCYENESSLITRNIILYEVIKNTKFFNFYIEKCNDFSVPIKEFFFHFRIFVSNLLREISKKTSDKISLSEIESLVQKLVRSLVYISISNLEYLYSKPLLKIELPKYHITVLACILKTVAKHKDKIIVSMMYEDYLFFSRRNEIKTMKLELYKKIVEELCVFGIIYSKRDEKYTFTYELKYSSIELKNGIMKLDSFNNFEIGLKGYLNDVF